MPFKSVSWLLQVSVGLVDVSITVLCTYCRTARLNVHHLLTYL